jgi:hypothetical protein
MPRISVCLIALVVVGLLVAAAPAAASSPLSIGAHLALGTGTYGPGCTTGGNEFCDSRSFSFHLAAVSGAAGSPAFGYFDRINSANGHSFAGSVTCMSVVGGKTAVGGFLTKPTDPSAPVFLVYVSDSGLPGAAVDGISPFYVFGPGEALPAPGFPLVCPSASSPDGYFALTGGDIFVR